MYEVRLSPTLLNIMDSLRNKPFFPPENSTIGIDLSVSWTNTSFTSVRTKRPPSLHARSSQALWYDDERNIIYAFGGDNPSQEQAAPPPTDSIQGFTPDGNGGGSWKEILGFVGEKPFPLNIHGTSSGMYTSDDKNAYYNGGFISSHTSPSVSTREYANLDLLRLNFETITLTSSSRLALPFYRGIFLNVPIYGSDGVLLAFGGSGQGPMGLNVLNIFDKKEQKWYTQMAEGDIPQPRDLACAVGVHEKNNKTFEMQVFFHFKFGV